MTKLRRTAEEHTPDGALYLFETENPERETITAVIENEKRLREGTERPDGRRTSRSTIRTAPAVKCECARGTSIVQRQYGVDRQREPQRGNAVTMKQKTCVCSERHGYVCMFAESYTNG